MTRICCWKLPVAHGKLIGPKQSGDLVIRLRLSDDTGKAFALSFIEVAEQFTQLPAWTIVPGEYVSHRHAKGLSNTDRIELLINWWETTRDSRFSDVALKLARSPIDGLDPWRDGNEVIELIAKLRDGDYFEELPHASDIADCLEAAAVAMIEQNMTSEELEKISDAVDD